MNRCTVSSGSSTAKLLATATTSRSLWSPCSRELPTRWKLIGACQNRDFRSTTKQTSQSSNPGVSSGALSDHEIGLREIGENPVAEQKGVSQTGSSDSLKSYPPAEIYTNSTSTSNAPLAVPSIGISQDVSKSAVRRRPLPISPLMDPSFLEARGKHHAPKSLPSKNLTPFQQQLLKNPYALALATPVRRCAISGTKLPMFFLQGFRVMSDPTTGDPWYVPANLTSKSPPSRGRQASAGVEEGHSWEAVDEPQSGVEIDASIETTDLETSAKLENSMDSDDVPTYSKWGYQAYTLNSKFLLSGMVDRVSRKRGKRKREGGQAKLIPNAWRAIKSAMRAYGEAGWRPDMDDFVSTLMGRRIAEAFVYLSKKKRGYLIGCTDWEDALRKPQVAAFLWTGSMGGDATTGPSEFATLDVGSQDISDIGPQLRRKKRKVPVYNLLVLLGKEKMDELRALIPNSVFEKQVVVLKHKNATVDTQSLLWKLQGYLAEHHDSSATESESYRRDTQADQVIDASEDFESLH